MREGLQKRVNWGGDDPFTHTLVIGPTRCGKTATLLKPLIYQILEERARGKKVGLSIIEPKGDVISAVKEICDTIGEKCTYINPLDHKNSDAINVMQGDKSSVAEATVAVLKSLFGKQEAFFATVQELSTRKITLLLKELYGEQMYITDVLANLRDESILRQNVQKLKQKGTDDDLVGFFEYELLNGKDADKYRQLIIGLRAQLENITSNEFLRPIITKPSTIDLDEHFRNGGILGVNTALGKLGKAGDAFGQFLAMHLQLATFRRDGTEKTRVPHYLIIDEYSRYINPDVERFLSIAAEYRVALICAIQSLGQIELESGMTSATAMKQAILTNCRNKIIFGGLSGVDAKEISVELGEDTIIDKEKTFDGSVSKQLKERQFRETETEKARFPYTLLMDGLPRLHYVHKLLKDGFPQQPGVAVGNFIPRDPEEIRKHFLEIKGEVSEEVSLIQELEMLERENVPKWNIKRSFENMKRKAYLRVVVRKQLEKQQKLNDLLTFNPFEKTVEDNMKIPIQLEDNSESPKEIPKIVFKKRTKIEVKEDVAEPSEQIINEQQVERKENEAVNVSEIEKEEITTESLIEEDEKLEAIKDEVAVSDEIVEKETLAEEDPFLDLTQVSEEVEAIKEPPPTKKEKKVEPKKQPISKEEQNEDVFWEELF
uniref:TraD/TraG TraM recognition site domain-containing protein n=1 Tax=Anaerobacillus isosaccharinicus TaxID=1532552 RepID=A0A1S2L1G5_9BACI|nr:type IV secretory system conjugative DNA transfer family protein [Anaerobacillus isosaccharinicus]QOY38537.1 type IV secretory system conjugative DNA transfer family protein [Anaerobacillus isosaccharinicus]